MAGARQKPTDLLVNRRGGRGRELLVAERPEGWKPPALPIPARSAHRKVRQFWTAFWKSRASLAVDPEADAERLHHWVEAMNDREHLMERIRIDGWTVAGSQSWKEAVVGGPADGATMIVRQLVAHPLLQHVKHLDHEIQKHAEHFGQTPLARFRLQLTYAQAGKETASLNDILARRESALPPANEVIDVDALG